MTSTPADEPVATEPLWAICGHRENNGAGTWECVLDADVCDGRHYLIRINERNPS